MAASTRTLNAQRRERQRTAAAANDSRSRPRREPRPASPGRAAPRGSDRHREASPSLPVPGEPLNAPERPRRLSRRRDLVLLDYALLVLGFLSLLILALQLTGGLLPVERQWLVRVDIAAMIAFGLALIGKLLRVDSPWGYFKANWWAVFGLLPLTQPLFIEPRFYVVVQLLIVFARFSEGLDRAFGERVLAGIFARYRAAIIEELTDPLLDRLLQELQDNLTRGRYTESIGKTMAERRDRIHAAVARGIEASPKLSRVSRIPGVQGYLDDVVNEAVDAAVATLTSEDLNRLIQESLDRAFEDIRASVRVRRWKEKGVPVKEVAAGLMRET